MIPGNYTTGNNNKTCNCIDFDNNTGNQKTNYTGMKFVIYTLSKYL